MHSLRETCSARDSFMARESFRGCRRLRRWPRAGSGSFFDVILWQAARKWRSTRHQGRPDAFCEFVRRGGLIINKRFTAWFTGPKKRNARAKTIELPVFAHHFFRGSRPTSPWRN